MSDNFEMIQMIIIGIIVKTIATKLNTISNALFTTAYPPERGVTLTSTAGVFPTNSKSPKCEDNAVSLGTK